MWTPAAWTSNKMLNTLAAAMGVKNRQRTHRRLRRQRAREGPHSEMLA
jgi:hypothetical protein